MTDEVSEERSADYFMLRHPRAEMGDQHRIGAGSLAIALIGLGFVLAAGPVRRRRFDRWHGTLALILLAEVIVAWCYRMFTAATSGANIGGGVALFFVLPVVGLLLLAAWRRSGATGGKSLIIEVVVTGVGVLWVLLLAGVSLWLSLALIAVAVVAVSTRTRQTPGHRKRKTLPGPSEKVVAFPVTQLPQTE